MAIFLLLFLSFSTIASEIKIGAKKFTEANILAHVVAQEINKIDKQVKTKVIENIGGSGIIFSALESGEIDAYVDYSGTLVQNLKSDLENLRGALESRGIRMGVKLGFNNSYGLAVKKGSSLKKISDLNTHHKIGISYEYHKRKDGWGSLANVYQLTNEPILLEHSLLYDAIESKELDAIEVYTTDAKIAKNKLFILKDDQEFFPRYDALIVFNKKSYKNYRELFEKLEKNLKDQISNEEMIRANYLVSIEKKSYREAALMLTGERDSVTEKKNSLLFDLVLEHLFFLIVTVLICFLVGVPFGVLTTRSPLAEAIVLNTVSILQTIPSLALLVFLIPLFGLGKLTSIVALVIYGLLPVVKNTNLGIKNIPQELTEYTTLIGMSEFEKVLKIELPLARDEILAGLKLCSIYTVGITVIAAFVGAGGLGTLIVTGLSLNDHQIVLQGAIPAALIAILVELFFEKIIPRFLQRRDFL